MEHRSCLWVPTHKQELEVLNPFRIPDPPDPPSRSDCDFWVAQTLGNWLASPSATTSLILGPGPPSLKMWSPQLIADLLHITRLNGLQKVVLTNIWRFPKMRGYPKNTILRGFCIINHPFLGTPILREPHIDRCN